MFRGKLEESWRREENEAGGGGAEIGGSGWRECDISMLLPDWRRGIADDMEDIISPGGWTFFFFGMVAPIPPMKESLVIGGLMLLLLLLLFLGRLGMLQESILKRIDPKKQ